jgi:hypothetical protein
MQRTGLERYAPLAGVVWVVVVVGTFIWVGDTPDTDSSTAKVVKYWSDHDTEQAVASAIIAVALVFFVWFAGTLRAALRAAEGGVGRLSAISYGGALIFAAGGVISLSLTFAVADTVGDVPPVVTHSLFIVSDDVWFWVPVGTALFLLPAAAIALRTGFLPTWLGWITLVIGVLAITPVGFFAWLASLIWILGVSILLFRRGQAPAAPPPAPAGPAA